MFSIYLKLRTKHDLRDQIVHNTIRLMWNSTWMLGIKRTYNSIVWFLNINPINHFLWFSTIDNSICWVFFQDHCVDFIGFVLCDIHLRELQVHASCPYSNCKGILYPILELYCLLLSSTLTKCQNYQR